MSKSPTLKIRKIGNSYGLILNRELMDSLGVAEGDELYAIHTSEGVQLTPYDPDFAAVMDSTRDYMRRHRNALHELSKR
ncbi:MAG: AbrB/MazE/SpoVT family DNA-binding domain-containing protein [Gammaproteobacteria bacterium]|nr:AbrB/MazE/SpoVT family DNA-binding domain-containing protein [Gammaproteobacteria bacterium]